MARMLNVRTWAALFFSACALLQLYPLPFHPADSVRDPGDPLLNTWIMAWVQDTAFTAPHRLFDAPIFHPLANTLSFSEHLLPQALLSLPVRLIFNNPVLAYNFVFFFSFLFAAYAMFLLVRRLTGNDAAGILCGLIFAFNGYHMDHVAHLQLLSSGLIPLTFLFLHDAFEEKKLKQAVFAALAFTLQGLASVYYGLFLFSILLAAVPLMLYIHRRDIRFSFLAGLGLPFLFSAGVLFVFSTPYLRLFKTHDFMRPLNAGADLIHYLAPPPTNVFLGKLLSSLGAPERHLFPGIAVVILAGLFLFHRRRGKKILYPVLLLWALLLSLGGRPLLLGRVSVDIPLPFEWFYTIVPGFKGIREPSRYAIFVVFCLTVMAGYGLKHLLEREKNPRIKFGIAAGLALFINLESLNIPQRIEYVPVRQDISPAARWLGEREGDFAVIDLPFLHPIPRETMSMYFSIFHGKSLINGYSGFIPPSIFHIRQKFAGFPSTASCDILDALGVKYVVIRPELWNEKTAEKKMDRLEGDFAHRLRRVQEFSYEIRKPSMILPPAGREWIYEVIPGKQPKPAKEIRNLREIPASRWTISSNISGHLLPALKDGDLRTRWTTERGKTTGDYLLIEFVEDVRMERVSLFPGPSANDYALDFLVETSMDGRTWHVLDSGYSFLTFLLDQIRTPRNAVQHLEFNGETLRFLKITQIGDQKDFYWTVAELKLFEALFQ